ncbi:sugar ABC transporter substrate-binding protein, partial [Rhizobium ruizarguesonis]
AEAENNVAFNTASGQMTVTNSGAADWKLHVRRFVDATVQSLPFALVLPQSSGTSEFVNTAWQSEMQQALTGQSTSQQMLEQ